MHTSASMVREKKPGWEKKTVTYQSGTLSLFLGSFIFKSFLDLQYFPSKVNFKNKIPKLKKDKGSTSQQPAYHHCKV